MKRMRECCETKKGSKHKENCYLAPKPVESQLQKGRLPIGTQFHAHYLGGEWEGILVINGMTPKTKNKGLHALISTLCADFYKNDLKSGPTGDIL